MNSVSYIILACYPDKGMKSHGSKSLMMFHNKKLLEHQITAIEKFHNKKSSYEIIVISDFDTYKLQKAFNQIKVVELKENNPIFFGCYNAKYHNILFIDYGSIFNTKTFKNLNLLSNNSQVLCIKNYTSGKLDVGCIKDSSAIHMFLDLPENKFCNIFYISKHDTKKILDNHIKYAKENLLYFEIINLLSNSNSDIDVKYTDSSNYIYFNNMRQKNAINKFLK